MERWEYLRLVVGPTQSKKLIKYTDHFSQKLCKYDEMSLTYAEICSDGWRLMSVAIYGDEEIHTFEKRLEPELPKAPAIEI